jgi:hypothetical protein
LAQYHCGSIKFTELEPFTKRLRLTRPDRGLKSSKIYSCLIDHDPIPVGPRLNDHTDRVAQPRHTGVHRGARMHRSRVTPHSLNQLVESDNLVRAQEQDRQQSPLSSRTDPQMTPVGDNLKRAENAKFQTFPPEVAVSQRGAY